MRDKLTIEGMHEPNGEGNGWEICDDSKATAWFVVCNDEEDLDAFGTREEAEAFVRDYHEPGVW